MIQVEKFSKRPETLPVKALPEVGAIHPGYWRLRRISFFLISEIFFTHSIASESEFTNLKAVRQTWLNSFPKIIFRFPGLQLPPQSSNEAKSEGCLLAAAFAFSNPYSPGFLRHRSVSYSCAAGSWDCLWNNSETLSMTSGTIPTTLSAVPELADICKSFT